MLNKDDILDELELHGYPENEFALSYEEFFEDNDDNSTIGVNIPINKPSVQEFFEVFQHIAEYPEVDGIFVRITDIEYPQDWFFTDTVYIVGDIDLELLKELTESIYPDEINKGWMFGFPKNLDKNLEKKKVISLWWD